MLYDEYYLSYTIIPIVSTAKSPNSDQYRYCLEAFKVREFMYRANYMVREL